MRAESLPDQHPNRCSRLRYIHMVLSLTCLVLSVSYFFIDASRVWTRRVTLILTWAGLSFTVPMAVYLTRRGVLGISGKKKTLKRRIPYSQAIPVPGLTMHLAEQPSNDEKIEFEISTDRTSSVHDGRLKPNTNLGTGTVKVGRE